MAHRNAHRDLIGKPEGKRRIGKPRRRWYDIKIDGWEGMGSIYMGEDTDRWRTVVNAVTNIQLPYNMGNVLCKCYVLQKDCPAWSGLVK